MFAPELQPLLEVKLCSGAGWLWAPPGSPAHGKGPVASAEVRHGQPGSLWGRGRMPGACSRSFRSASHSENSPL